MNVKQQIAAFLRDELKLELSDEKTLITHARNEKARFLGYDVHVYHADDKHDHRGQRCLNGGIGLRVPKRVIEARCAKFTRGGKPIHLPKRLNDRPFGIVATYQAEYRGIVDYYRLAYNLGDFGKLKWVAQGSLVKTLANKLQCSSRQVYRKYQARLATIDGAYKVLMVTVERGADKKPLRAYFGAIPLRRDDWAKLRETESVVWSGRSELTQRLLAQECELCGSSVDIEVHHIRKLADLKGASRWEKVMAARRRKTLVVCLACHQKIHSGRYDGPALAHKQSLESRMR